MKRLFILPTILLASCAPTVVTNKVKTEDRPDKIFYTFKSPSEVRVQVTPKAVFPKPERFYDIIFNCAYEKPYGDVEAYLAVQPGVISGNSIKLSDFSVDCENGGVFVKASDIQRALSGLGGGINTAYATNTLQVLRFSGYKYPNIQEGFYRENITVEFGGNKIVAYDGDAGRKSIIQNSIVGARQNGVLRQVMYGDKNTPITFNPAMPVEISYTPYVYAGTSSWYAIDLDVAGGRIGWRALSGPPTP